MKFALSIFAKRKLAEYAIESSKLATIQIDYSKFQKEISHYLKSHPDNFAFEKFEYLQVDFRKLVEVKFALSKEHLHKFHYLNYEFFNTH